MDGFDSETGEIVEQRLPAMTDNRPQNLIFASNDCGEVFGALCDMQGDMAAPKRTKEAKVKGRTRNGGEYEYTYNYAPLDEIIATIKAPMKTAGLAYRQFLAQRNGQHVMRTIIAHRSGQWMGTDYPIFWDETRGMQGFASGVTYARRYGLMLALGIAAEDDDDANVADGNPAKVQDRKPARPQTTPNPHHGMPAPPPLQQPIQSPQPQPTINRAEAWDRYVAFRDAVKAATLGDELDAMFAAEDWKDLQADLIALGEGKRIDALIKFRNHKAGMV